MKVSNASPIGALQSLTARGLINYVPYDVITLNSALYRKIEPWENFLYNSVKKNQNNYEIKPKVRKRRKRHNHP